MDPRELGERIREARGTRKVDALLLGTGIDPATWNRYETGKGGSMKVATLYRVAEILGTDVGVLLGETATPAPAIPLDTIEQADRLAHEAAELATRLREAGRMTPEKIREEPSRWGGDVRPFPGRGLSNVDEPRDLHEEEIEIVAYAAAGQDRHPEEVPSGETYLVLAPIARTARRKNWKVVKVVGDSMEPDYSDGDFVVVEPARESTMHSGDIAYVMFNGEGMLKKLAFTRERGNGRIANMRLESTNPAHKPIPVSEDDWFHPIGIEVYGVRRKGLR